MKKAAVGILLGVMFMAGTIWGQKAEPSVSGLRIGWASRDITPSGKVNLAGQFGMRITTEVKDPLSVTALALSRGDNAADAVIFVSCDTVTIPAYMVDRCREKIAAVSKDFPVRNLIINATHTHTAPDTRPGVYNYELLSAEEKAGLIGIEAYSDFMMDQIVAAVLESWNRRQEGSAAWGIGYAVVGHNRRAVYLKDFSERPEYQETPGQKVETNAQMYGNTNDPWFSHIEGYEDHAVQFLFTFDQDRKLTGSVINLACPSQETEHLMQVSADFWHEIRVAVREKYGPGLFILPQCSAAGDQSPHLLLYKQAEARRLQLKGVEARQEIGAHVAAAFDETLSWAQKDQQSHLSLRHHVLNVDLPKRQVSEEEYRQNLQWIQDLQAKGDDRMAVRFAARCQKVVNDYEEQQKNSARVQPVELHVVRLGDLIFATNPFELFLDYGVSIQAQSPAVQTFIVQLASKGVPYGGSYLPTARAEQGGGYSACMYCNTVGAAGGRMLVDETLAAIKTMFLIAPEELAQGVSWPESWTVFVPSAPDAPAPAPEYLQAIPEQIKTATELLTPRQVVVRGDKFDFAELFGGAKKGKTAYVYLPVTSPCEQQTLLGFGADWWMEVWLNGQRILDTTSKGNGAWPPSVGDHLVKVKLRQGQNILAIRFIGGSGTSVLAVGGPDALRANRILDYRSASER